MAATGTGVGETFRRPTKLRHVVVLNANHTFLKVGLRSSVVRRIISRKFYRPTDKIKRPSGVRVCILSGRRRLFRFRRFVGVPPDAEFARKTPEPTTGFDYSDETCYSFQMSANSFSSQQPDDFPIIFQYSFTVLIERLFLNYRKHRRDSCTTVLDPIGPRRNPLSSR